MILFLWVCIVWFGLSAFTSALLITVAKDRPGLKALRVLLFTIELALAYAAWGLLP